MPYPQLYVAFYRPRYGNYQHWALYLQHGDDHTIYELIESSPNFRKNKLKVDPQTSRRYLGKLLVASLGESDIPLVSRAVKDAEVDNTTVEWDCQDYVIEIIERLEEDLVLDEADEDYRRARKALKKKRGAIV